MKTIIQYTKLPLSFEADVMLAEVNKLSAEWLLHYNSNDFSGEWKALPLRSVSGNVTNVLAQSSSTDDFQDTVLMDQCPEIKKVLESFLCKKTAVRLLNLRAGAIVKEHKDPGLCYEEGEVRIHVPLITNNDVLFYSEDDLLNMKAGECWYANFNLRHRLANNSAADRIHLVFDCVVNDWVHELFAAADDSDKKIIEVEEAYSINDKMQMIEHLKLINTPVSRELIVQLENELLHVSNESETNN